MFWGLILGIIPPLSLNVILPVFGIYGISWLGPIASAVWIFIIGYSIIRYRQMNVRIVITEMLAIAMTVIFFINIFVKAQLGVWQDIMTFLVFLLLASYLIRSILVETKQKEQLRDLNENLEQKVAEQTVEIRKSYDLEKKARRELEKLNETKDQFIMITQHNIRSPLNNIKNGIESLVSDKDNNQSLHEVEKSLKRLTKVTNDFLSITTIKAGGNILNLSKSNLLETIKAVLEELRVDIKQKNLSVSLSEKDGGWEPVNMDQSKMHDAFLIILENAVRYNKDGGKIDIQSSIKNDLLSVWINDTGIGLSTEDQKKIAGSLFYRSPLAKKLNSLGMGVGLSVAKAIIKAHHGNLNIHSEGENKGTEVIVNIPLDYLKSLPLA